MLSSPHHLQQPADVAVGTSSSSSSLPSPTANEDELPSPVATQESPLGGIDDAQQQLLLPQPPTINNYFQSNNSNNHNSINVDNIFASMTETEGNGEGGNNAHSSTTDSNTIFHNFASMSMNSEPILDHADSSPVPFGNYSSDYSANHHHRPSGRIEASTITTTTTAAAAAISSENSHTNNAKENANILTRSGSEGLSKSMSPTAGVLRLFNRNMSESESDPPTIRHAGYLLKRSNLPFTTTPDGSMPTSITTPAHATSTKRRSIGDIAPLPDLSLEEDNTTENDLLTLPFGGLGDSEGEEKATLKGGHLDIAVGPSSTSTMKSDIFQPILDSTSAPSIPTTEDTFDDECINATAADEPCFCSPFVQYFQKLWHIQGPSNALATNNNKCQYDSASKRSRKPKKRPQTSPAINRYNVPLKAPARSDPVPISPAGNKKIIDTTTMPRRESSGGQILSQSYTNGGRRIAANDLIISASSVITKKKEYPPPPPDYIDPKDGHIWRAKYCILEEGILYFYRTAEEGESEEAKVERYESRLYAEEGEDIILGEEVDHFRTSSPRAMSGVTSPSGGGSRRAMSMEDRKNSRDLFDLSKSPMPQKKSYMFDLTKSPFHRSGSSLPLTGVENSADDDVGRPPTLYHSNSTGTFHHDADILWEKRVSLDCVGAVRSSDQLHGKHAFELLAYGGSGEEHSDVSTRASGSGTGATIIDRLILRAGSSDDMNTWMFQFHRALASFMQQIVNRVRSASDASVVRPDSPHNRRLPTPMHGASGKGGSIVSPLLLSKQSFASSPTAGTIGGSNSFHESFSPNISSLSHGHGRNALYRRQVRDSKSSGSNANISPLPTPSGTPRGGSSPVDAVPNADGSLLLKRKPYMPMMIQADSSKSKNKVELPSLIGLREKEKQDTCVVDEPKKYIPPHMRRKLAAASGGSGTGGDGAAVVSRKATEKQVPLNDEAMKKPIMDDDGRAHSEVLDESLSDSALSATSASSLLSRQLEEGEAISTSINIRLGGCADPTVVVGSIVDIHYKERKSSVVGNARLEAYGGTGGGFYASFDRHRRNSSRSDDSLMLDDLDNVDMTGGMNSGRPRRRSVLKWEVGASSECGVRNSNEDSYVVINNLDELIQSQGLMSFSQQDLGQTKQQSLYAIFDGHVGNQAARFSAEKFPPILAEEQSSLASRDSACQISIEERADIVLREAFDRLDKEFCSLCTKDGRDWDCGSTALVALIVDDVVSLANLGDCRGVVCRLVSSDNVSDAKMTDNGWEALDLHQEDEDLMWDRANGGGDAYTSRRNGKLFWKEVTETHSPLSDEERERIERANGWIIRETEIPIGQLHRMDIFDEDVVEIVKRCFADRMKQHRSDPVRQIQIARTCGDLAVSRAIGDRDFKAAYNTPSKCGRSWDGPLVFIYPEGHSGTFHGDIVSNVPDIKFFRVGEEGVIDEFLLMACDGLWDVMDGDDAVRIAKDLLFDKKMSAKDGAARLAELAQHLGSSDNITVILIRFYWEECDDDSL